MCCLNNQLLRRRPLFLLRGLVKGAYECGRVCINVSYYYLSLAIPKEGPSFKIRMSNGGQSQMLSPGQNLLDFPTDPRSNTQPLSYRLLYNHNVSEPAR